MSDVYLLFRFHFFFQIRKAHDISEKCVVFLYLQGVGSHTQENYSGRDYDDTFLYLKVYNPRTFQWHSFGAFLLQNFDVRFRYNGNRRGWTSLTLDSDIYIIPLRGFEFWVLRGKSHKLERVNLPNEENWSTDFALTLHGKLIVGSWIDQSKSVSFLSFFVNC